MQFLLAHATLALIPSTLRPLRAPTCRMASPGGWIPPPPKDGDFVDIFCRALNDAMEKTVVLPVRRNLQPRDATKQGDFWETVTSPPEYPGLSRPVWLTIAASVPTALGWYGYYKFCVEEELFYDELKRHGRTTGAGGYGTLILFSWCVLLGGLGTIAAVPHADLLIDAGAAWILFGQVNLYIRVNELFAEKGEPPPVHAWWALLPPPLDVVVGLRQVHFLAKYWADVRGDEWKRDTVAEELFPFISSPRFTLREFASRPSLWFGFTKNWQDFDLKSLPLLAEPETEGAKH